MDLVSAKSLIEEILCSNTLENQKTYDILDLNRVNYSKMDLLLNLFFPKWINLFDKNFSTLTDRLGLDFWVNRSYTKINNEKILDGLFNRNKISHTEDFSVSHNQFVFDCGKCLACLVMKNIKISFVIEIRNSPKRDDKPIFKTNPGFVERLVEEKWTDEEKEKFSWVKHRECIRSDDITLIDIFLDWWKRSNKNKKESDRYDYYFVCCWFLNDLLIDDNIRILKQYENFSTHMSGLISFNK